MELNKPAGRDTALLYDKLVAQVKLSEGKLSAGRKNLTEGRVEGTSEATEARQVNG
jgi:hypothetical protein